MVEDQYVKAQGSIPACAGEPARRSRSLLLPRVYPRVCGGTVILDREDMWARGLSPRVRGNRCYRMGCRSARGSIPACAGEPSWRSMISCWPRVYPRVCGGTADQRHVNALLGGLSPRVRGNLLDDLLLRGPLGSIPACAGEPPPRRAGTSAPQVYPRVCGGTRTSPPRPTPSTGLSPRVRGNPNLRTLCRGCHGSIPACAGEPIACPAPSRPSKVYPRGCGGTATGGVWGGGSCRVYPRVCGGTCGGPGGERQPTGLSPRVRGNRMRRRAGTTRARSIPACAGEPEAFIFWPSFVKVYPRVCGGTLRYDPQTTPGLGLSPRVRGNHPELDLIPIPYGSIPACAGEPRSAAPRSCTSRVYPRVCGGTVARSCGTPGAAGLSPRVRGNRAVVSPRAARSGSIPACAGEPVPGSPCPSKPGVYPRVCGGTRAGKAVPVEAGGLSPRVRGNRDTYLGHASRQRSIPACAGEPSTSSSEGAEPEVYPRVCGGTSGTLKAGPPAPGLSPRVRGNPQLIGILVERDGSIPACAGEPARSSTGSR